MRKPHFESKFQSIRRIDLFIRLHIMFQISFQSSKGQISYRKFLGVRSELLLSILCTEKCKGTFDLKCTLFFLFCSKKNIWYSIETPQSLQVGSNAYQQSMFFEQK